MQWSLASADLIWHSPWPAIIGWSLLYISDYCMTLSCARMYQGGARQTMELEGSYEITPAFQKDIDSLKSWSPRFITALVVGVVLLYAIWWLSTVSERGLYEFTIGLMIGVQLVIHTRHLRNFSLFRAIVSGEGLVRGRIEYARLLGLRMSANELLSFSAVFGVLCIFVPSWFLFGAAVGCLAMSANHRKLARAHASGHKAGDAAKPREAELTSAD